MTGPGPAGDTDAPPPGVPRVVLVGPSGYGRVHLAGLRRRHAAGELTLVAVADRPGAAAPELPDGTRFTTRWREALGGPGGDQGISADVAVIATPPQLHVEMALAAFATGLDVLLEKPAALDVAGLDAIAGAARAAGVRCQVGYQSLGSAALDTLRAAIAAGDLGELTGVGVAGAWRRSERYFRRTPWAGRRLPDGRPGDGTVVNPFAHAVVNALAVAGAPQGRDAEVADGAGAVEAERYRANDIEVDDTSSLRLRTTGGLAVTIATTLCSDRELDPVVHVRGSRGTAALDYQNDVLTLGGRTHELAGQRVDLLDDLLDARAGRVSGLRCPVERTRPALLAVEQAMAAAGEPARLPGDAVRRETAEDGTRAAVVPGVTGAVRACAERGLLLSETGAPWAPALQAARSEPTPGDEPTRGAKPTRETKPTRGDEPPCAATA